jgi:Kef-type K+ transport system membrane component KefB
MSQSVAGKGAVRSLPASLLACAALAVAAGALFLLIRAWGESLTAQAVVPGASGPAASASGKGAPLLRVLFALAAVVLVGRVLARLFAWVGQPAVIGEVVAGILLGPSLVGKQASAWILPPETAPYLGVLAQLGVVLYMFLVGLELSAGLLRLQAHITAVVSLSGIVAPFLLGAGLALWLYPVLSHQGVSFTSFSLFLGVSLSITAFPVLARILSDRGMEKTPLGVLALGCAAASDVAGWCLLALVMGLVETQISGALIVLVLALGFIVVMGACVRPVAVWWARRHEKEPLSTASVAWVFLAVLLAGLATEAIGIHAIFGAFLLGVVIPHDSRLAREVTGKVQDMATALLLPAFFAYTGMRTEIGLVSGWSQWLMCGAITLAATAGKLGGCYAAGRLTGLDRRTAASLGVLMNTRGLMELIVLNIGLELGVISSTLFSMMVIMAVVTTLATTPLLRWLSASSAKPPAAS